MIIMMIGLSVLLVSISVLSWYADRGCLAFFHPMRSPRPGQIRVACVGDSITYGYGIHSWHRNNYPSQLSRLLGQGYCVNNYGYSGRTASPDGDFPYTREKLYRQSMEFQPDIILLMLGTNDAKPQNWLDAGAYTGHIRNYVEAYRMLPSNPVVWLLTPPPAWENPFSIAPATVLDAQQAVREYAEAEDVPLFDTSPVFEGRPDLFQDGIHPNKAGAFALAQTIYETMKGRTS